MYYFGGPKILTAYNYKCSRASTQHHDDHLAGINNSSLRSQSGMGLGFSRILHQSTRWWWRGVGRTRALRCLALDCFEPTPCVAGYSLMLIRPYAPQPNSLIGPSALVWGLWGSLLGTCAYQIRQMPVVSVAVECRA